MGRGAPIIPITPISLIWTNHRLGELRQAETFYRLGFVPARIAALPNGLQVPLDNQGLHVGGFLAGAVLMPLFSGLLGTNRRSRVRQESPGQEEADNAGGFW